MAWENLKEDIAEEFGIGTDDDGSDQWEAQAAVRVSRRKAYLAAWYKPQSEARRLIREAKQRDRLAEEEARMAAYAAWKEAIQWHKAKQPSRAKKRPRTQNISVNQKIILARRAELREQHLAELKRTGRTCRCGGCRAAEDRLATNR